MSKNYIVMDFETYYDKEYTIRKMTPVEYILDHRFEVTGCAVAEGDDGNAEFLSEIEFDHYVNTLRARQSRGDRVVVVSHNALFDMCILGWRYGLVPDLMIDTMGMSRARYAAFTNGVSLDKIATYLGLSHKTHAIQKVVGMRAVDIQQNGLWNEYADYACNDVDLCRRIFQLCRDGFPAQEYLVLDSVLRCAVVPRFQLDRGLLATHAATIESSKANLLATAGIDDKRDLMSNDKFAEALRTLGVEPPRKISPVTGQEAYAFAKTDTAMAELEEHENPVVQALVAARLGHKSTLEETRTARLQTISALTWPGKLQELMPIPLRYSGAHTHRLSGDWKLNLQNLPRGGTLRKALVAPKGQVVIVRDASQIEARINAWLAGQDDLVQAFANGRDIYSEFAGEEIYRRPITKADKPERFIGKTAILGLGYNMGGPKFRTSVQTGSRLQLGLEIPLSDEEADKVVKAYRRRYSRIPVQWKTLQGLLSQMNNVNCNVQYGPCMVRYQRITLPNGLELYYHNLRSNGNEWRFTYGGKPKYIYGGKMYENVVQALARIVIMNAAIMMRKRWPQYPLALQVHDELVYVVDEHDAIAFDKDLAECMETPPGWGAGIPLASEGDIGESYGACK